MSLGKFFKFDRTFCFDKYTIYENRIECEYKYSIDIPISSAYYLQPAIPLWKPFSEQKNKTKAIL